MHLTKFLRLWFPVAFWVAFIFFLSSISDLKTGLEFDFILRKIYHAVEYFILVFLLYRAFAGSFNMNTVRLFIYPAVISFLYAISDELHQLFVPGRNCSIWDVLIDTFGIFAFFIIYISLFRKKRIIAV